MLERELLRLATRTGELVAAARTQLAPSRSKCATTTFQTVSRSHLNEATNATQRVYQTAARAVRLARRFIRRWTGASCQAHRSAGRAAAAVRKRHCRTLERERGVAPLIKQLTKVKGKFGRDGLTSARLLAHAEMWLILVP